MREYSTFRSRVDDIGKFRMVKVQETFVLRYEAPVLRMT